MNARPARGPLTIAELQEQVDRFHQRLQIAESGMATLVEGTHELNRPSGVAVRVRCVQDELTLARQGLVNARRVLTDARSIPDYDELVKAYRNGWLVHCEGDADKYAGSTSKETHKPP